LENNPKNLAPVTVVISEIVLSTRVKEYETWVSGINQVVANFKGFLGVDVIRPRDSNHLEYVVIVRFDTYQNLDNWQKSQLSKKWLEKSQHMVERQSHSMQVTGLELWFTLPKNTHVQNRPPAYYKQVLIGIMAVYPLVLLVNMLLAPILISVPYLFGVFLSVIAISMLMTYPVMPWLTRRLNTWLYPANRNKK